MLDALKDRDPAQRWEATREAAPAPPARIAFQPQPPAGAGPQGGATRTNPGAARPPAGAPPAGSPGSSLGTTPGAGTPSLPAPGSSLGTTPSPGSSLGTVPAPGSSLGRTPDPQFRPPGSTQDPTLDQPRPFDRPLEGLPGSPLGTPSGVAPAPGSATPGSPLGSETPGGNLDGFGNDNLTPTPDMLPSEGGEAEEGGLSAARPIVSSPKQLRPITDIRPHWDYSADPDADDPCLYLCPRPDGLPCKTYGTDQRVPACPDEVTLGDEPFVPRVMPPSVYAWKASNIAYNPLYFEDVQLERYGHTYGCLQPAASLGRFGVQLIGLPYQMALDPPCKCVYPLGYYRPGECAPKLCYQIPLNARAALVTAGFYSGLGVILP